MDIGIGLGEEPGPSGGRDQKSEEEYHYEVLSTDQIVQHMVESIKEVNSVIQVSQENYASFQFSMMYKNTNESIIPLSKIKDSKEVPLEY